MGPRLSVSGDWESPHRAHRNRAKPVQLQRWRLGTRVRYGLQAEPSDVGKAGRRKWPLVQMRVKAGSLGTRPVQAHRALHLKVSCVRFHDLLS